MNREGDQTYKSTVCMAVPTNEQRHCHLWFQRTETPAAAVLGLSRTGKP